MTELRYNPLLKDWTMVASNRQARPQMPADYCPFCPGSGKVPDHYEVFAYDNDFPALSPYPPEPDVQGTELYPVKSAYGKCEVILYSSDHHSALSKLSVAHIKKLINLWEERFIEMSRDPNHKYVLIFENRGVEVGVTMPHPHGQIYAYPYIPQKIRIELEASKEHHEKTGQCLICDITQEEVNFTLRIIEETEHFIAYIPFFTDYPFGAMITSKTHRPGITDLTNNEKTDLALILKRMVAGMDELFSREFPYMMVVHQSPVNTEPVDKYYHFHIEFYPPLRDQSKIKFLASSETGAWAPCNPTAVEDTSVMIREAILRARAKEDTNNA